MKPVLKVCSFRSLLFVHLLLMIAASALSTPTVKVHNDRDIYSSGETIELSLGGENYDDPIDVDVYVGLIDIDGVIYTLGESGWAEGLSPWLVGLYVPNPFYQGLAPFHRFDIPCTMPPIADEGKYSFAAVLTHPDTFDFISDVSFATFAVGDNTWHVYVSAETGSDWNDGTQLSPYRTITHALTSVEGSKARPVTIHVAAGTYSNENNGETFPLNMKRWVTLSGECAEMTIVNANENAAHVVFCAGVDSVVIRNLTITGGSADDPWPDCNGGGICCLDSSIRIENNIITRNSARNSIWREECVYGGGICCYRGSAVIRGNVVTDNSIFDGNPYDSRYAYGGGIYSSGDPTLIQDNVISDNSGQANTSGCFAAYGGGICCSGSSAIIRENYISNNRLDGLSADGAGIFIWGSVTVEANTIVGNNGQDGGGVYCSSSAMVRANLIQDNYAEDSGSAVCCTGSPTIEGNIIENNWSLYGSAITCRYESTAHIIDNIVIENRQGIESSDSSPIISHNTVAGNALHGIGCCYGGYPLIENNISAYNGEDGIGIGDGPQPEIRSNTIVGNGYGIFSYRWDHPPVVDCIIWGNDDDLYKCSATFCCIEDQDEGEGNIHTDPMFVEGPLGEYYLHPDSPCINAGSQLAVDAGLADRTTHGNGTPDTGTVDMGYHYPLPTADGGRRMRDE
ncbi:MAG: right-handed parallel beta-helix repeat-containing protein [Candidatus Coatesbacteria bacterium]|nr:right-handed parallel beta-helix repeat-containing protein [Candidatus Coatesbacteria bacterium]